MSAENLLLIQTDEWPGYLLGPDYGDHHARNENRDHYAREYPREYGERAIVIVVIEYADEEEVETVALLRGLHGTDDDYLPLPVHSR